MKFQNPAYLWLLSLGILILALHLYRRGGRLHWVPFLSLWENALVEGEHPGWRKLRGFLSLLLQLTILALITFSLAQPFLMEESEDTVNFSLVLDNSAKLMAREGSGKTRWDLLLEKALQILDQKEPGDQVALLVSSPRPAVVAPPSVDRDEVKRHLKDLRPFYAEGDFPGAVSLGRQIWQAGEKGRVLAVVGSKEKSQDEGCTILPVGKSEENVGFTSFHLQRIGFGAGYEASVAVKNFGKEKARFFVETSTGEKREFLLSPQEEQGAQFPGREPGVLVFTCSIYPADGLLLDNEVWGILAPIERISAAHVADGAAHTCFASLFAAFSEIFKKEPVFHSPLSFAGTDEKYDLVIFDRWAPPEFPNGRAFLFFQTPPSWLPEVKGRANQDQEWVVKDWAREDPLLRSLDLSDFYAAGEIRSVESPDITPLISSTMGEILFRGKESGCPYLYFPFSLSKSNLSLLPAFPILFRNAVQEFFHVWDSRKDVVENPDAVAGQWKEWNGSFAENLQIYLSTTEGFPLLSPGIYERAGEKQEKEILCLNFLNPSQSSIIPLSEGTQATPLFSRGTKEGQRSVRWLLLLLGIGLLILEGCGYWWFRRKMEYPFK